jgi:hypothetical protein
VLAEAETTAAADGWVRLRDTLGPDDSHEDGTTRTKRRKTTLGDEDDEEQVDAGTDGASRAGKGLHRRATLMLSCCVARGVGGGGQPTCRALSGSSCRSSNGLLPSSETCWRRSPGRWVEVGSRSPRRPSHRSPWLTTPVCAEVRAKARPENSLLQEDLEFDQLTAPGREIPTLQRKAGAPACGAELLVHPQRRR